MDAQDALTIGARVRKIRSRRGLSQDVAAGLAGITKGYLSLLELGQRARLFGGRPDRAAVCAGGPGDS